jgi:hypothetical protein
MVALYSHPSSRFYNRRVCNEFIDSSFLSIAGPESVLVINNAFIHYIKCIKQMYYNAGIEVVPLPLYSLDFNLIIKGFYKIRSLLFSITSNIIKNNYLYNISFIIINLF